MKNRKVHIVISSFDYEGGKLRGVFTSRVKAEECLVDLQEGRFNGDWHSISEVELNANIKFIDIPTQDETILEVNNNGR